jgi:flagellar biosynthesis chaperone FliJ
MEINVNYSNLVKYGVGAAVLGISGFAALFLIKSIVALAIVTIGSLALWNFLPVFAQWAGQMKIKGIKYNSAKNPVEDLQLIYMKKSKEIEAAAIAITSFSKETKEYKEKLDSFIQRRPERADSFTSTYNSMKKVLDIQLSKLKQSKDKLKEFEGVIIEAEDIWNMTQAALKANKAMRKFDMPDPMDEIRQRTAYDSILGSLNQVTAELETAIALDYTKLDEEKLLTNDKSPVMIDVVQFNQKEKV